jgi:hypothetical protein
MNEIKIEEFEQNGNKRISILTYQGDGDPVIKLNEKMIEYTKGQKYWEFIDMNMDNPFTRVIVFGDL